MDCVKLARLAIIKDDNNEALDRILNGLNRCGEIDDMMIDVDEPARKPVISVILKHASVKCMELLVNEYNIGTQNKELLPNALYQACDQYTQCYDPEKKRNIQK